MIKSIRELIKHSKENPDEDIEYDVCNVGNMQAQQINKDTGIRVLDCKYILNASAVRHIIKRHANETRKDQLSVTEGDIEQIPNILKTYDSVIKGENSARGAQALIFEKKIGKKTYRLVMSKQPKSNKLAVNTLYIKS